MTTPHRSEGDSSHVAILMATYQGADYLAAQLDSIEAQSLERWTLWVSDDGSQDGTREILAHYRQRWGEQRLKCFDGPREGFARNFMSLLCNGGIRADYYAFADQDDIWLPGKLEDAIECLARRDAETPALYCSRTRLVNQQGIETGISASLRRPPGFANALVQNIASGNTMVFNHCARQFAARHGARQDIPLHDWWIYLVVTGCGGFVYFSDQPGLFYRQHAGNAIGMRLGPGTLPRRLCRLWRGGHYLQIERNLKALSLLQSDLTVDSRQRFEAYLSSRRRHGFRRLASLHASGVYRQTLTGQLAMLIAAVFNKT
ncbi:glycosyltransferase family 2 protein [Kushneria aurantia]|nr:glycosyltransferase family 2 protein [Kushneria aurantia]